jgi:hypothetical protein
MLRVEFYTYFLVNLIKMKKTLYALAVCLALFCTGACKKDSTAAPVSYPIAGLWIGTYTFNTQAPLYFSFTIYPDGSMSYKSKGSNDYTFYANGTWTMTGSIFSYTVTTTNTPGATQSTQSGTATYSNTGKLTNGININVLTKESGTFSMTRVN